MYMQTSDIRPTSPEKAQLQMSTDQIYTMHYIITFQSRVEEKR
jgi:hypothetical protein